MIVPAGRPGPAFYLAGDSFPADTRVERSLARRLTRHFGGWTGQAALAPAGFDRDIAARAAALEAVLSDGPALSDVVLIGRSSGARVVTEVACRRPVRAVICLAYPFQRPGAAEDRARVDHLARLTVPTLILQGTRDAYGTPAAARGYRLAPSIRVVALDADHRLALATPDWDAACRLILDFCAQAGEVLDLTG